MSKTPGFEIERKYLLSEVPSGEDLAAHGARAEDLTQYYLANDRGAPLRRLRVLGVGPTARYLYTEKRALGGITREEREHSLDASEAAVLLGQADPAFAPIRKVRWTWEEDGQTWELDVFVAPADLVLLEVELSSADEAVTVPAWLGASLDVSEDPRYQNAELARSLARRA